MSESIDHWYKTAQKRAQKIESQAARIEALEGVLAATPLTLRLLKECHEALDPRGEGGIFGDGETPDELIDRIEKALPILRAALKQKGGK